MLRRYLVSLGLGMVLAGNLLWLPATTLADPPPDPNTAATPPAPAAAPAAPAASGVNSAQGGKTAKDFRLPNKEIKLNAPLPGGSREGTTQIAPGEASTGGYLMEYIRVIYTYVAGLAGLLAVLMMVLGGFQVMISGTNPEGVGAGKQKIINAVGGLVLLLVSALLLYSINPNAFTVLPQNPDAATPAGGPGGAGGAGGTSTPGTGGASGSGS